MALFPDGDNNPIDIYPIKSPLDGGEYFEIPNEGTKKLYGRISDVQVYSMGIPYVISNSVTAPPGSPTDQDSYLIPAGATGAWAGHADSFAVYVSTSATWTIVPPRDGWITYVASAAASYTYTSSAWAVMSSGGGSPSAGAADYVGPATSVSGLTISATVNAIMTSGYAAAGDGGGDVYKRVVSEPAHTAKLHSADGAWWELSPAGRINFLAFGADRTGVANSSTAFNNAIAFGAAKGFYAFCAPRGSYLLNTTALFPSTTSLEGDGVFETTFVPGMTDGSACIKIGNVTRAQFFRVSGFSITTSVVYATFATGAATGQNCIGLDTGDRTTGPNAQTRWGIDNIFIHGCHIGWNAYGWSGVAHNVHIELCDIGLAGELMNACSLNLHMENNRRTMTFLNAFGVAFVNYWDESDVANTLTSTVDQCNGVSFVAPYFECVADYQRTTPFMSVGVTTECNSFSLIGGTMAGSAGMATGVPPLLLDRVNNAIIQTSVAEGTQGYGVQTTANTRNLDLKYSPSYYMQQDNSKTQGPAANYFANPRFDAGIKGWGYVASTRATYAIENAIVRRGLNAVRLTATAGAGFNYMTFRLTGAPLAAIKGKTVRLGAWIWVPNITAYNEASRTAFPSALLQSYNGTTLILSTTKTDAMVRNAWNYYTTTLAIQSDATYVDVTVYANQDSATVTGAEYLVIDEITLVDEASNMFDQMQGKYLNSESLPLFNGTTMDAFGTVASYGSSTGETYAVGDKIWNSAVAALGTPGFVCTTGGPGGTAVWSNMPSLV